MNEKNGIYTTTKLIKRVRNGTEAEGIDENEEGYTQYSTALKRYSIFKTWKTEKRECPQVLD